jgi:transglutaminase-like putative cysteine protease
MKIQFGYEFIYSFPQATPVILTTNVHYSRASDILVPDHLTTEPAVPITAYRDSFGNWCNRVVAPPGRIRLAAHGVVRDSGIPDAAVPSAMQHAIEDLPGEILVFLLGSRYCETDLLSGTAWQLFGNTTPGWARVQAICDFVHNHIPAQPHRSPANHRRTAHPALRNAVLPRRLEACPFGFETRRLQKRGDISIEFRIPV